MVATKLKKSGKGQHRKDFRASHAVVIGINDYQNGIQKLKTPVNDAVRLAEQLQGEHGYTVTLLVEEVTKARLEKCFTVNLPPMIGEDDRLLVYFAGHGVALDGEDGPQGFLVPGDADPQDRGSFLPMTELHAWLNALTARHMLAILDCCFAGAFRWAATRALDVLPEVIHQERFERYLISPAWQALTSAAYDQRALDVVAGRAVGSRGIREEDGQRHSPFALALYDALRGEGDLVPKGDGDGVITATELYLYLREQVEVEADEKANHDQTPGLWPLNKHGKGEYIFLTPGHELNLPPAPDLTEDLNPWRGLKSYNEEHRELFFGRDQEIEQLCDRVHRQPFTAVLGASGTGKSSLVKAGLLPNLEAEGGWLVLPPLRPGATPILNLHRLLGEGLPGYDEQTNQPTNQQTFSSLITAWKNDHPDQRLLLVVDQLEELVTMASDDERKQFLAMLATAVQEHPDTFRLVTTLRTDFEPQFDAGNPLAPHWHNARYVVPPMTQADLRQVIEGPASVRVLYFEPPELVDQLITEVIQTPGALPLLSFTLSEMYIHYLKSGRDNRALTQEDYEALGGVIGSLRTRANEEYESLPDDAHRETMEKVMLRMISVEGGELARRRVPETELVYVDPAENERVQYVLDRLVKARLMVTGDEEGEPVVEPAHDALVLAWDNLLRWKNEADDYLLLQRQLAAAVGLWAAAADTAKSGFLWDDDPRLPILEETLWPTRGKKQGFRRQLRWAKQVILPNKEIPIDTNWLNGADVAFVRSSVTGRAKFWRRIIMITTVVVFALALLAVFAGQQANEATNQANLAATNEAAANARSLAAQAETALERKDPKASYKLAVQAVGNDEREGPPVSEADVALFHALDTLPDRTTLVGHTGVVRSAIFNHDSSRIVTASSDGTARLWDGQGNLLTVLEGHTDNVWTAVFNHDGSRILTASSDGTARLWDGEGTFITTLEGHGSWVGSGKFSNEGSRILTTSGDGTARLWEGEGAFITALEGHTGAINSAVFNHDGSRILTASEDGTARLWAGKGNFIAELGGHEWGAWTAVFNHDGSRIMTTGRLGRVRLWDEEGAFISEIVAGFSESIRSASFNHDGSRILTVAGSGAVTLRDSEGTFLTQLEGSAKSAIFNHDGSRILAGNRLYDGEGALLTVLDGHTGAVNSAVFNHNENLILTASSDGTAKLWDGEGAFITALAGHAEGVWTAVFNHDGSHILTAGCDGRDGDTKCNAGTAKLWDGEGAFITTLEGHTHRVWSAVYNPDSSRILTASEDGTARLWDEEGVFITALEGHMGQVRSAAFNHDGSRIVTASWDKTARLWDGEGAFITALVGHTGVVRSAVFNHDGSRILTASNDGTARLWDGEGVLLTILEGHTDDVWTAVFNHDGSRILTASSDGTARLWDEQGTFIKALEGHTGEVWTAVFNHDGSRILTASSDRTARLWDGQGSFITALAGLIGEVWSATFNHDGSRILAGTRLYDGEGAFITNLIGHESRVWSGIFNHDGSRILTASEDGTARLWETYSSIEAMRAIALHRLMFLWSKEECEDDLDEADCSGTVSAPTLAAVEESNEQGIVVDEYPIAYPGADDFFNFESPSEFFIDPPFESETIEAYPGANDGLFGGLIEVSPPADNPAESTDSAYPAPGEGAEGY